MDTADAFLALSPEGFGAFITTSPPPPAFATQDFAFAHVLETANTPSLSLAFPQASHEYPPLMSSELMQLFGASEIMPQTVTRPPQFLLSQDIPSVNTHTFSFPPELLANTAITPAMIAMIPQQTQLQPQPQMQLQMQMQQIQQVPVQSTVATSQVGVVPHLDIKAEPTDTPWLSYMHEVLSHPLPFQSSLASITSNACQMPANPQSVPFQVPIIKQELTSPQSSALQKLHQRLLQRLRKSQQDCPIQEEPEDELLGVIMEPAQMVISESSKKADSSFNKVLELFSFYFNTQKTASPLACTAALYLGQVGFELQKRYEAYSRYMKCGVLEEILISMTRASNLRKLGIKSYEEFLRAEVGELRRIKDPERYLNRRMQVFQSYEPEELEGVYLSFDALYLLAKKPPSFRKEWLEEGKVRIVHICEIHEAWRSSPLNKTKRARTPEVEESNDAGTQKAKVLKSEH